MACSLWFNLFSIIVFLISQPTLLNFSETLATLYIMHTLQVQQFSDLCCYVSLLHSIPYVEG